MMHFVLADHVLRPLQIEGKSFVGALKGDIVVQSYWPQVMDLRLSIVNYQR